MRAVVLLTAGLVAAAWAASADETWVSLGGDAARDALSGKVLGYANGATQSFSPSGDTSYDSGHLQPGRWRIDGDRYCSQWPPSDLWSCYGLGLSADGTTVRFTAGDGSTTDGRYLSVP